MRSTALACALLAMSATGCAPRTAYVAPEPEHVDAYAAYKENANWKPAQPADSTARGAWWEVFNDPGLSELEARVDVSNQTLKTAEAQFVQARALVRGARANLYPLVTAASSASTVRPSGNRGFTSFHDRYADLVLGGDVSYEADVWGRIHGIVQVNRATAQATEADLETARLSLHAELALDYFGLRGTDREREILNSAVEAFAQALELTQNRFQGGLSSQQDVAQAETQLETTRAQAVDLDVERAALEHAIAVLVGEPPSTFTISDGGLAPAPPGVPAGVPSDLLERRPDISGAERRVASATAQVDVTRAAYYPILTLSGASGFESSSFGSWLASASNFWTAGPAALQTVFDAGRRRATTDQARAALDQVSASYQQSVLTAFREVEDQLAALRILEEEAGIQDRAVAASERSLTLATNRYRGGVTSYLEVITAQSAALANERTAVDILVRRMGATVLLLKGLGGDWRRSKLQNADGK